MKIAIVLNGISLEKKKFFEKFLPVIQKSFSVDVYETTSKNAGFSLAGKALEKGNDVIISAGGDGTLHQVINGVLKEHEWVRELPVIGVLPIGTGNDFTRSLNAATSPQEFVERLKNLRTKLVDIGTVSFSSTPNKISAQYDDQRYFINVVDVGMGPEVVRKVLSSGRPFGSAFAYYKSILTTFLSYTPYHLNAKTNDWQWGDKMRTFAVANGKYYGHGLCIAPDAVLDDGLFEVFAVGPVSVFDFIVQSIPLKQGKRIDHPQVSYFKTQSIELSATEPALVEADGEVVGWLPAKVDIIPKKLKVLC